MGLLEAKVALVTGAAGGLGRASALALAREGARVCLVDLGTDLQGRGRSEEPVQSALADLTAQGAQGAAACLDVSTEEGALAAVARAVEAFGGLDVVVNAAGFARDRPVLKMDPESFDAVLAAQLRGTFLVCRAAARRFVDQRRGGSIVNVCALSALFASVGQCNLAAAQGGVYGLTRTLANELKKHQVRVNAVAPTARTRMTEALPLFGPGGLGDDRMGPHFVAPAVLFLASSLSTGLTGEVLSVAGSRVSVLRLQETDGLLAEDPRSPWTAEALRDRWAELVRG
ncbi:MAG: SDR family oxidoreductase [Deltaproteobacteria bacterium]|nr:SDR family oxidoreductase [Deltaproteobacteria bacterium]